MHALALKFTYLWKLNRGHWLRVWRHICMWPQLWTGRKCINMCRHTHTHAREERTLNSWECLQCERVVRCLRLAQWPCAVCVCTAPRAQTEFVSVSFAIQAHSEARFCWRRTQNCQGLAPGRTCKTGAKFIEKSRRISDMHLIHVAFCFLLLLLIMFRHSSPGHRDIKCVRFHYLFFYF